MQKYTWIYILADTLTKAQRQQLEVAFSNFLNKWTSHGRSIAGKIWIPYNRFVVIQANSDEDRPSGCSIDDMKRSVEKLLQELSFAWLDASYIAYKDEVSDIQVVHFQEIEKWVQMGKLSPNTIIFDNSLDQTDDLEKWERPMAKTWMRRFLSNDALVE